MTIEIIQTNPIVLELNLNPVPVNGADGASAYEVAVQNGFVGTEQDWLNDLKTINWSSTDW
jgi:hypothetical protein